MNLGPKTLSALQELLAKNNVTPFPSTSGQRNSLGSNQIDGVIVQITGNGGGGKYTGNVLTFPTADVPSTGTLSAAEIGVASQAAVIVNCGEVGSTGNCLSVDSVHVGKLRRINSDGKWVVAINRPKTKVVTLVTAITGGTCTAGGVSFTITDGDYVVFDDE